MEKLNIVNVTGNVTDKCENNDENSNNVLNNNKVVITENTEKNVATNKQNEATYATALRSEKYSSRFVFPEKDQAFVMDAPQGIAKNDFIMGVGKLIGPKNVIFASRITNQRICIYLASKQVLEKFMNENKGVHIGDSFYPAKRLVAPSKRIILSNVSPSIPNSVIYDELERLKLRTVSAISFIGAGVNDPNYRHVLSFRRQVYISMEDEPELPASILIKYNGESNRIYFTSDEMRCFLCNALGHTSVVCPTHKKSDDNEKAKQSSEKTNKDTEITSEVIVHNKGKTQVDKKMDSSNELRKVVVGDTGKSDLAKDKKRPAETSTDSLTATSDEPQMATEDNFKKPKPKKLKTKQTQDLPVSDSELFVEFAELFRETSQVIDYKSFCEFLSEVKGQQKSRFYIDLKN